MDQEGIITNTESDELEILCNLSGTSAKNYVDQLSAVKNRIPGSEGERRAAEMIAQEFEKLDLDVSIEEFKAKSWEHEQSHLLLSSGSRKNFETELMPYSPAINAEGGKGLLCCLRFGFPAEYASLGDETYIPLVDWEEDWGAIAQVLTAAHSHKKIAALGIISPFENGHRIDAVPMLAKPITFPVFSLTKEDGRFLKELCQREKVIGQIEGKSRIIPDATSANVIGLKKGKTEPELKIVVSAHHDSWLDAVNDNIASVASVLEVARALSDIDTRRSIEFISFGCEEAGTDGYQYYLWGSRQFLERHGKSPEQFACQFNSEFAGNCNSNFLLVDCTPDLLSFFEVIFDRLKETSQYAENVDFGATIPVNSQADQLPFTYRGISSSLLYWAWYDEYHSDLDRPDTIDINRLHLFSELLLLCALRASQLEILPLSLTRYARVIRMGHTDQSYCLANNIRKVIIHGSDQLKSFSSELLDFSALTSALDSFATKSAYFERSLSSSGAEKSKESNVQLVKSCQILNRSLCRIGGIFGEEPLFPGFLPYIEELRKIDCVLESIRKVSGADISSELKSEFHPMFKPEVDLSDFDIYSEYKSLHQKRERARELLQKEIDRIAESLREAEYHLK